MRRFAILSALLLLVSCGLWAQASPFTAILDLAHQQEGKGLALLSGADGVYRLSTAPDGTPACEFGFSKECSYLYFQVRLPDAILPGALYVQVEYYDNGAGGLNLQYSKLGGGAYTAADGIVPFLNSNKWRKGTWKLEAPACDRRENLGSDFRLSCFQQVWVRKITVSSAPLPGGVDKAALLKELNALQPGVAKDFEFTVGISGGLGEIRSSIANWKRCGFKDAEIYVRWDKLEPQPGEWDYSSYDPAVEELASWGMKWMPFLIAGPAYATPKWYRDSRYSLFTTCLEHHKASLIQSIFNPDMPKRVDTFLQKAAGHWDDGRLDYILLGISGTYGESIYAAGPSGGWTAQQAGEEYHNHRGWWAAEAPAVASFQAWLKAKYGSIESLNAAWHSHYRTFNEVRTFIPTEKDAPRKGLDMAYWYTGAMTKWVGVWEGLARKHFPDKEVYMCTGGAGDVEIGADFAAQAQELAKFPNSGIRITNEGSNYLNNFAITRMVASACRFFGIKFGFEPASRCDADGIVGRIFNAISSGANQLHDYNGNVNSSKLYADRISKYAHLLHKRQPIIETALFFPRATCYLDSSEFGPFFAAAKALRDYVDLDYVDYTLINAGALERYKLVVLPQARFVEPEVLSKLLDWVKAGGVCVVQRQAEPWLVTPEGSSALKQELLGPLQQLKAGSPLQLRPITAGNVLLKLEVGKSGDASWLRGHWYGTEENPQAPSPEQTHWRWSADRASVVLPVWFKGPAKLVIGGSPYGEVNFARGKLLLEGHELVSLEEPGDGDFVFNVPAQWLADKHQVKLEFVFNPVRPSDSGQHDDRPLGFMLNFVEFGPASARTVDTKCLNERFMSAELDRAGLERCMYSLGKGKVVLLPEVESTAGELAALVGAMVKEAPQLGLDSDFVHAVDCKQDGLFTALCRKSLLWYNDTDEARQARAEVKGKVYSAEVPPHSIVERPLEQAL